MTSSWAGADLGTRTVAYDERDVILYALAVGAAATDLDLVFEQRLRVLPTFALTLAQWAPDVLAEHGAWDANSAVHGAQRLVARAPLPRAGKITMTARVDHVWDKGSAAIFDITVESEHFLATWSIFAPGRGGFGGQRGPTSPAPPQREPDGAVQCPTATNQAALYRLTGDRHLIHIDPGAAAAIGAPRPILHGLCTLATASLQLSAATGNHPADLAEISGRFTAPVLPGELLDLTFWHSVQPAAYTFQVETAGRPVIAAGSAQF